MLQQATNQRLIGTIDNQTLARLEELGQAPQSAIIAMGKGDLMHAIREHKQKIGLNIPISFREVLPNKLQQFKAILLDKNNSKVLLYIYEIDKSKLAIKLNYTIKIDDLKGKKQRKVVNILRTVT